jgi:hypothetical protein
VSGSAWWTAGPPGAQLFFLGYPLHFDWSRLTDMKSSAPWNFDFWVGFDF